MVAILVPALYGLSGVCAYAALHHGLIAARRPVERTHLLFALTCLVGALYIIAKVGVYQSDSAQALVEARRWASSVAMVFLAVFPWFVAEYTAVRRIRLLTGLSVLLALVFGANLALPYGITYAELPDFERLVLPWGEQVADLRLPRYGAWHTAMWLGILVTFGYAIYACVRQYRRGARRRAFTFALALGLFFLFVGFNQVIGRGGVRFVHIAEFGFIALMVVMSLGLTREIRESGRRIQAVLDNVPAVVYMKDPGGHYLLVNRAYEEAFRVTSASVAGKTDHDLFPAAQADAFRANDRRVLETRRTWEFEETASRDGEARAYRSIRFPLLDPDGVPYAVCGVSTDVTERRKAEQEMRSLRGQLWHADRVVQTGALSASLAHELNQPLAAILSNAQAGGRLLAGTHPDLREIREILEDIVRDDKRASAVIASLRAMVRRQETERVLIDISETLGEVLKLLRSELVGRQVEVITDFEAGCTALADKVQIQQVALNLVMNAAEAMSGQAASDRRLRLAVSRAGSETRIAVRDSGAGIPKDEIDKVFDPFRTTKLQGMGIGLAVCRSIIESHGGAIGIESNDDRGVTVFFTLPLVPSSAAAPPARSQAQV